MGEGRVQAWVVGSGGDDGRGRGARGGAGATTYRWSSTPTRSSTSTPRSTRPALLTPHAGELAAMLGVERAEVEARPAGASPAAPRAEYAATVLLKGHHTLVAAPGRPGAGHHDRHAVARRRRRRRRARRALRCAARGRPHAVRRRRRSAPGCTAPPRPTPPAGGPTRPTRAVAAVIAALRSSATLAVGAIVTIPAAPGTAGTGMGGWRHERRRSVDPRSWSTWPRSGATSGILRDLVAPDGSDVMVGGQGRRLRARDGRVGRRRPRRPARPGSASPPSRRRSRLREAGDTGRLLCWLTVPGDDWAAAIERDVDVTAYSVAELDEIRAAGRRGTPARRPAQDRHRPLPRRLDRRPLARRCWPRPAPARPTASGGSPASGRTSRAATSPSTPPTTPRSARSATRSPAPSAAGLRPEVRHLANSGRRDPAPVAAGSTWCAAGIAAYGLDPAPGVTPRPRPASRR